MQKQVNTFFFLSYFQGFIKFEDLELVRQSDRIRQQRNLLRNRSQPRVPRLGLQHHLRDLRNRFPGSQVLQLGAEQPDPDRRRIQEIEQRQRPRPQAKSDLGTRLGIVPRTGELDQR